MKNRHKVIALGAMTLVLLGRSPAGAGDFCRATPFKFEREASLVSVGKFKVKLSSPDDDVSPQAWDGPVTVTTDGTAQTCTIDISVGVISKPLMAFNGDHLVLDTYSGSTSAAVTLDLANCRISGQMKRSNGTIGIKGTQVVLNGKPVKGITCAD